MAGLERMYLYSSGTEADGKSGFIEGRTEVGGKQKGSLRAKSAVYPPVGPYPKRQNTLSRA